MVLMSLDLHNTVWVSLTVALSATRRAYARVASREWGGDEGDGLFGILAVGSEPCSDGETARRPQDAQGDIAQCGDDDGPVPGMQQARVLAQVHILAAMALILNQPMASFQGQQTLWRTDRWRQTGDAIADLPLGLSALLPGSLGAEQLALAQT